jgi:hypothetical protein
MNANANRPKDWRGAVSSNVKAACMKNPDVSNVIVKMRGLTSLEGGVTLDLLTSMEMGSLHFNLKRRGLRLRRIEGKLITDACNFPNGFGLMAVRGIDTSVPDKGTDSIIFVDKRTKFRVVLRAAASH